MAIEFPNLSQMALNILSIPPSSCDCERSFSKLGNILKPYYSRIYRSLTVYTKLEP